MKIIIALLIFSVIIIIHEFGHFLLAKRHGIVVTEFALGMGPILWKREYKGTVYAVKALPFGGSCMMLGEDSPDEDGVGTFNSKSVWARISVVLAGPVFNFILAFLLAIFIVGYLGYDSNVLFEVERRPMKRGLETATRSYRLIIHLSTCTKISEPIYS